MEIWTLSIDTLAAWRRALVGCSNHTAAQLVAERGAAGVQPPRAARTLVITELLPKVVQWAEDSHGNIRADVAQDKLMAMGFTGAPRTLPPRSLR